MERSPGAVRGVAATRLLPGVGRRARAGRRSELTIPTASADRRASASAGRPSLWMEQCPREAKGPPVSSRWLRGGSFFWRELSSTGVGVVRVRRRSRRVIPFRGVRVLCPMVNTPTLCDRRLVVPCPMLRGFTSIGKGGTGLGGRFRNLLAMCRRGDAPVQCSGD